ncbi:MAG: dihydrofolate reductase family protein, partial [bacterium]
KVVFSRTLKSVSWNNTTLVKDGIADTVRALKSEPGPGITLMGSGSIVAQLAQEGLIDTYQFVVYPIALGKGRTMFDGIADTLSLRPTRTRQFKNGCVVLWYECDT